MNKPFFKKRKPWEKVDSMGAMDGLRNAYFALEDKYYGLIDWLGSKGIPLNRVVDAIEKHNIPSFPIMLILLILIIAGLFFLLSGAIAPQATFSIIVKEADTGLGVESADITLIDAAGAKHNKATGADGKATISAAAGEASVSVEKTGFTKFDGKITVAEAKEETVELEKETTTLTKTIQLMKAGTNELIDKTVSIRFSCSSPAASDFSATEESVNGEIELQIPSNCGNLLATPVAGYTAVNGTIDASATAPQLFLQAIALNSGTIRVNVKDASNAALSGLTVMAYTEDAVLSGTTYSSAAGTALFENIETGTYYILVHDSQGRYADFDSSQLGTAGLKELQKDGTITFDAVLQLASVGKIKMVVKDAGSKEGVENAAIYLKKNNATIDTVYTDAGGAAEFNVTENVAYSLEVDAAGYLIATVSNVTSAATAKEIFLQAATADNTQTLIVEVVDSRQKPIDNVRLLLKKPDGTIYANDKVTGADGKAEFTNLPLGTYYIYAAKKGFEGKTSDPFTIKARQENKLTVELPIGWGSVEISVLSDEATAVQGAIVEAINAVTGEKEGEGITGLDGKYTFSLRADKKVYFKIDAADFLPYYSIAVMSDPNSTLAVDVALAKDPGQLQVKVIGFFKDGEKAPENLELGPGQKYTAKLLLLVAKKEKFDEAGIHFRTGEALEEKTNIMEEDAVFIKEVSASTANVLRGTSFTPPTGYAIDAGYLTTGDSKWLNIVWKNAGPGAYAAEVEVQVKESAALGQMLPMWYRAWGKAATFSRFPADSALAGSESTAEKQALYAKANSIKASVGPTNLCNDAFCKTFSIEDMAKNIRLSVVQQYNATIGGGYKLFYTISSISEQAFTNCTIEFGSQADGVRFGNYSITDAAGVKSSGNANGYGISNPIGNMQKDSVIFGSVEFKAEKEGSNILTIVIKSNNQPVLSESIDVKVAAAAELQLDLIPKEIIPLIDNQLLVKASDSNGQGVSNAIVSIYLNDTLLTATESNGQGIVEYKLEAPATGSTLLIKAEKTGYRKALLSTTIDSSILIVTPPSISEKLDALLNSVEKELLLSNQTIAELTITKLKFNFGEQQLVKFTWDDEYIGQKIKSNNDLNAYLSIALTEKGMAVEKPVKLEGSLAIHLKSGSTAASFVQNLPITIRIGLGGEVDDLKCLQIDPVKWEIIADSETKQSMEFTLTNKCVVQGEAIALHALQAKITETKESGLGTFTISSEALPDAKTPTLGSSGFSDFADILPKEFEGTIKIEFSPNRSVDSGTAKLSIEFKAINSAEKGEEAIQLKLPTEVHVSSLSKCVVVEAETPILVETVPFNQGYGLYSGGTSGYNPLMNQGMGGYLGSSYGGMGGYGGTGYGGVGGYGSTGYGSTGYGSYGTSAGYGAGGYLGGSTFPNAGFDTSYYSRYYDQAQDNSWRYGLGESSFLVKNTCSNAVEIDLDVPAMLRADKDAFSLEPNTDKTVKLEAGYRMGKYTIDVSAKLQGSEDKAQKIDSVDVLVRRSGEIDDECIQLSTDQISLSSFIAKPIPAKIFNYCYDVGIRLPKAGKVIDFTCQVPGQPVNVFNFAPASEEQGKVIQLQQFPDIMTQPSGFINQAPIGTAISPTTGQPYSPNEQMLPNGTYGTSYYQQGLAGQGYSYPYSQYPYGSSGWAYPQTYGYGGSCPLIQDVYFVSEHTSALDEETGRTLQTVEFEVSPNIEYRKQICQYAAQMPFETSYGLRATASSAYNRANVRASASVHYYNQFGGSDIKYFRVVLNDQWGYGETIDECLRQAGKVGIPGELLAKCKERGSATLKDPKDCVNSSALDLVSYFSGNNGFVEQSLFGGGSVAQFTPSRDVLVIPPCGGQDSVEIVNASYTDPKSNVTLYFKAIPNDCPPGTPLEKSNWSIAVTIDKTNMYNVQCAKIDTAIRVNLKRPTQWAKPVEVMLPVKAMVLHPGEKASEVNLATCTTAVPVVTPTVITACTGGSETGSGVFTKYGFDRLLFNWGWSGIEKQQCDEKDKGGKDTFCDAVQFSIELNRKAIDIKDFFANRVKFETANKENIKAALCEEGAADSCLDMYRNSKELFRWVKKQVVVKDNVDAQAQNWVNEDASIANVFFLKADNEILESENKESIKAKLSGVKPSTDAGVTTDNMAIIVEKTNDALNSITDEIDQRRIVALIKKEFAEKPEYAGNIEMMKIEKPTQATGALFNKYVMTFREYKVLHQKLWDALRGESPTDHCYKDEAKTQVIAKGDEQGRKEAKICVIGTRDVNLNFVKDLVSGIDKFVVGTIHLADEKKKDSVDFVIKNAADIAGLQWPTGYSSFADFYNKAISFKSFLIKDGYSPDLRSDFVQYYKDTLKVDEAGRFLDHTAFGNETQWAFGKSSKQESSYLLPEAGLYNVLINYVFAENTETPWNIALDLNKSLKQLDELSKDPNKTALASNFFFEMPFDGEVGSAGTDNTRTGYGIAFSNSPDQAQMYLTFNSEQDKMNLFNSKGGILPLTVDFGNTLDKTNTGLILQANSKAFNYNPSAATPIEIGLSPRTGTGIEGMLYKIVEDGTELGTPASVFSFRAQGLNDFADNQPYPLATARNLCYEIDRADMQGFQQQIANKTTFKGIAFVPFGKEYVMRFYCSQGAATVKSENNDGETIIVDAGFRNGQLAVTLNRPSATNTNKVTLPSFLDEINKSNVCVKTTDAGIELRWNNDKMLGAAQTAAAPTPPAGTPPGGSPSGARR